MKTKRISIVIMLAMCLTGCYAARDDIEASRTGFRNRRHASSAWRDYESLYDDMEYEDHFEDGFKDGYEAVASGRSECPPVLPPRKYWKSRYQNPEGHCKVVAWFDGYSHGAVAAAGDGAVHWSRVPTSTSIRHGYIPPGAAHEYEYESNDQNSPVVPPAPPANNDVSFNDGFSSRTGNSNLVGFAFEYGHSISSQTFESNEPLRKREY